MEMTVDERRTDKVAFGVNLGHGLAINMRSAFDDAAFATGNIQKCRFIRGSRVSYNQI
jgi:hypothetical protein